MWKEWFGLEDFKEDASLAELNILKMHTLTDEESVFMQPSRVLATKMYNTIREGESCCWRILRGNAGRR